jgi:hypothetical protein
VWLRVVSDSREAGVDSLPPLERLPTASLQTQTAKIGTTTGTELDDTGVSRAISVLQAGERMPDDTPAAPSERRAVFDGVVRYGEDLALIVESKPDGRFDKRQAREITIGNTAWQVEPVRARFRWRDIISAGRDLLLRDLVSGGERKVLEDFMWQVQRHFPQLQPFAELDACRGSAYLMRPAPRRRGPIRAADAELLRRRLGGAGPHHADNVDARRLPFRPLSINHKTQTPAT